MDSRHRQPNYGFWPQFYPARSGLLPPPHGTDMRFSTRGVAYRALKQERSSYPPPRFRKQQFPAYHPSFPRRRYSYNLNWPVQRHPIDDESQRRRPWHEKQQGNYSGSQQGNYSGVQQGNYIRSQQGNYTGSQHGNYTGSQHRNYTGSQHGNNSSSQKEIYSGSQQGNYTGSQHRNHTGSQHGNYTGSQQRIYSGPQQGTYSGSTHVNYTGSQHENYEGFQTNPVGFCPSTKTVSSDGKCCSQQTEPTHDGLTEPPSEVEDTTLREELEQKMLQDLKDMHLGWPNVTVFMPSCLYNKTRLELNQSWKVYVQKPQQESDVVGSRAMREVFEFLRHILKATQQKATTVFITYDFDNYLKNIDRMIADRRPEQKHTLYPFPDHRNLAEDKLEGEIDFLIVSEEFGCIVIETKGVCHRFQKAKLPNQETAATPMEMDENIRTVVQKTLEQLNSQENFLCHIFVDFFRNCSSSEPTPSNFGPQTDETFGSSTSDRASQSHGHSIDQKQHVRKVPAFPYVFRTDLKRAVAKDKKLVKAFCDCLCSKSLEDAVEKVLCADDFLTSMNPHESPSEQDLRIRRWTVVTGCHEGTCGRGLPKNVFNKIVARLGSLCSSITVPDKTGPLEARTASDCIHLTGLQYGRDILRDDQLRILESPEPFLLVRGPPGSGKTLVLALKGIEWARLGDHVVVYVPLRESKDVIWGSFISQRVYQRICQSLPNGDGAKQNNPGHTPVTKNKTTKKAKRATRSKTKGNNLDKVLADGQVEQKAEGIANVHTLTIYKGQNVEEAVKDLLARLPDKRPVRFIIDDGPWKKNKTMDLLTSSTVSLSEAKETLDELLQQLEKQARSSEGQVGRSVASPLCGQTEHICSHKSESLRPLFEELQRKLNSIKNDVQALGPPKERPLAMQTDEWKDAVDKISVSHEHIDSLFHRVSTSLLLPCRCLTLARPAQDAVEDELRPTTQPSDASSLFLPSEDCPILCPMCVTCRCSRCADAAVSSLSNAKQQLTLVSGNLYSAEQQLDFMIIDNLCACLVKLSGKESSEEREVSAWTSGVCPLYQPDGFVAEDLTVSLRCPPTVQAVLAMIEKDIEKQPKFQYQVNSLLDDRYPLPTDGPEVKLFDHNSHMSEFKEVLDCPVCGANLSNFLLHELQVGNENTLKPEDVAISGTIGLLQRPLFQKLKAQGLQLRGENDSPHPPPFPGKILVIGGSAFQGLESKIVVFIPDIKRVPSVDSPDAKEFRPELPTWLRTMGKWNRIHLWLIASRCLSQLIVFHV